MIMKVINTILLILVLGLAGFSLCQHQTISSLQEEQAALQEDVVAVEEGLIQVPDLAQSYVRLKDKQISIIERLDSGELNVIESGQYVPPEGSVEVVMVQDTTVIQELESVLQQISELEGQVTSEEDSLLLDSLQTEVTNLANQVHQVEVNVDDKGFTFRPHLGIGWNTGKGFPLFLGARLVYLSRFGGGVELFCDDIAKLVDGDLDELRPGLSVFADVRIPHFDNVGFKLSVDYSRNFEFGLGLNFYFN